MGELPRAGRQPKSGCPSWYVAIVAIFPSCSLFLPWIVPVSGAPQHLPDSCAGCTQHPLPRAATCCSPNCHSLGITARPSSPALCSCQLERVPPWSVTPADGGGARYGGLSPPPLSTPTTITRPLNALKQLGVDLRDWEKRSPQLGKSHLAVIKLCHHAGGRQKGTHNGIRIVIN